MILSINFYFFYNLFKILTFLKKKHVQFLWPDYLGFKNMTAADFGPII